MTREEVVQTLESGNHNQIDAVNIILENVGLTNNKKEPILFEEEERQIIEILYRYGLEDYYVEQRQAATAFLFHQKHLDVYISDLEAIVDYLGLYKVILSSMKLSNKLVDVIKQSDQKEVLKGLKELYLVTDLREDLIDIVLGLYKQTTETTGAAKQKIKQLSIIKKEYFKNIQSFEEVIEDKIKHVKKTNKDIHTKALWLEKNFNIEKLKELKTYSQTKPTEGEYRIFKLLQP